MTGHKLALAAVAALAGASALRRRGSAATDPDWLTPESRARYERLGVLDALLEAHAATVGNVRLSRQGRGVVTLFAGAGGADLGLAAAGWRSELMVEWNGQAAASLREAVREGFIEGEVLHADVFSVDYTRFRGAPLLWSSFPCQGYSPAGRREGMRDDRDGWAMTIRAVDQVEPRFFLGENSQGLTFHSRRACPLRVARSRPESCPACSLEEVMLRQLRQRFRFAEARVLRAEDFGVPQARRRVFLYAGDTPMQWPEPTHGPDRSLPHPTLGDALNLSAWDRLVPLAWGLRREEFEREFPGEDFDESQDDYYCLVCEADLSSQGAYGQRQCICPDMEFMESILSVPAPTVVGGSERGRAGGRGTMTASKGKRAEMDLAFEVAMKKQRGYTVEQALVIQGFPAAYPLQGNKTQRLRQIGNAVPPPLAAALGRSLGRMAGWYE